MNSYFLALQEMKDNFNDKYIVILDRKNADFLYKGFVSVEKYDYEEDEIFKRIFVFHLENGNMITFDFEDAIYVKLNKLDEYGLIYDNYLIMTNNLHKENIQNYINFQNIDFTNNDIENILYEKNQF
ncbi:hypothetical protein VC03_03070 [Sneathia vaginalis]|uniref:Uncharacterized protein n=1 Tax=Sneathia vaginalis TaxID=187101 RepID=A0A0E3UTU7_9FUSO|nr:hypothetical protein [Sneathia vaginalis]AKC95509.1 hypothetical protein VC03_03070 [Sneathia vaginalis]